MDDTLKSVKLWLTFAGGVLVVAVLYWAQAVLVPFALAILLTFRARLFGSRLKTALDVSAVAARVGVDTGRNLATSALGKIVKDALAKQGAHVRDNIHGLDVIPDHPNTRIFNMSATAIVHAAPDPLLSDLDELVQAAVTPSQRVADVILLLNYALMRPEPVAQIVFAVSAVESLGQDENWSPDQQQLLRELAAAANQHAIGTDDERREVADAIRKSLHRLTLRQGVFRLLDRLGLRHLKKPWDDLYAERSTLVHGLAPQPGTNYSGPRSPHCEPLRPDPAQGGRRRDPASGPACREVSTDNHETGCRETCHRFSDVYTGRSSGSKLRRRGAHSA